MDPAEDHDTVRPSGPQIVTIVLLNVAWMCATPCGTTRFSRFFLNSFFFFVDFAGACTAASCCGSFAKSVPSLEIYRFLRIWFCLLQNFTCARQPSSLPRRHPSAVLCVCAHSCACAGRAREDCAGAAGRDSTESRSAGGCSSGPPCGDRPRRGPRIQWPGGAG